jgi:hypothetical protein
MPNEKPSGGYGGYANFMDYAGLGMNLAGAGVQAYGQYQAYQQAQRQLEEERRRYEEAQRIEAEERRKRDMQQASQNTMAYGGYAQGQQDNRSRAYGGFAARVGL